MTDQIFTMTIEYPRIFDKPGQYADLDRGDAKSQQKWLRELAKNPETKFNAYFNSEEDMQKLLDSETFENETTNPQTGGKSTRIKDGNPELGIGKYVQLKRKLSDIKEFVDRKTGDLKEFEAGGLLKVTVYDEEKDAFVPYDYEKLGAPANGSVAKVRFNDKYMRPMNLGFVEVVEFTEGESEGVDF